MRNTGLFNLLVGVYVDDLIITGAHPQEINNFKKDMMKMFSMSDLGLLSYYFGIEVHQIKTGITLCQSAYSLKILEKCGMTNCNPCQEPMEARLKLSKVSSCPTDATFYPSVVGSLRYLVHTRPDIAYSDGYGSRFMENPTTEHLAAMKRILRYIKGSLNMGCYYQKRNEDVLHLTGYSDSDMTGNVDDRKSTTGAVFLLGESLISWKS